MTEITNLGQLESLVKRLRKKHPRNTPIAIKSFDRDRHNMVMSTLTPMGIATWQMKLRNRRGEVLLNSWEKGQQDDASTELTRLDQTIILFDCLPDFEMPKKKPA